MKRIGAVVLCLIICLSFFSAMPAFAEEKIGEDITDKVEMNFTVGKGTSRLLKDRNVETGCSSADRFELLIKSSEPIYGVYLLWNDAVAEWTLSDGTNSVSGGKNGFWHEYAELPGGTEYTMSWSGAPGAELAEIYFLSAGELPDFVQVWDTPCEKADILLLPTHADDEHLWFGGTMPYYAGELGYKIQVVYLMKHVSGRHHELLNGLWHVGIRNYPVISEFIDKYSGSLAHAKTLYPEDKVLEFLVENIRRFRPEVILGHDLDGEYGHGAHMLNAYVLSKFALEAANDPAQCPESAAKYGVWEPKKCYLHLYQENEIFIDWTAKILTAFGGKNSYDVAQEGFDCHVSQRTFFSMSLDDRSKYGNALFGLCYSTVGPDLLKNDFLENIPEEALTTWVVEADPVPDETPLPTDDSTEKEPELTATPSTDINTLPTATVPDWIIWIFAGVGILGVFGTALTVIFFLRKGSER